MASDHSIFSQRPISDIDRILSKGATSVHVTALDGLVNVNSLFTVAVFVGLSLATPGQRSLEDSGRCDAGEQSDVLGQFMPLVGKDWTQSGVAHLFSAIKDNGYQLLFLSARAIAQAYLTRQFLVNVKQDGKALPDGPVVISPDGLFPSLYREVIRRAPHEFKIACLEDIRALFPADCNPFYAGFGNRDTDEISYLKVGIPKGKVFIINPKGEVAVNRRLDRKSYTSLHKLVNGMFPARSSSEQEDFNAWNYWRVPLPDIDV